MSDEETTGIDTPDVKEERKVIAVDINGRSIKVRTFEATQFVQLSHEAQILQGDKYDTARKIKSLDRFYRVIVGSTIIDEDDRDFVEDELADGGLDLVELTKVLLAAMKGELQEAPPKVRRGTPRRR